MSIDSHSLERRRSRHRSSPGTSGYASQATAYIPRSTPGRSAQVAISIPAGRFDRRRLDRRQVEHEPRVCGRPRRTRAERPTRATRRRPPGRVPSARGTRARAPRRRARRASAVPTPRPRASSTTRTSPRATPSGECQPPITDRRADVRAVGRREQPDRLARLALPVEVALDGVRLVDGGLRRRDPALELALVDLADLRHDRGAYAAPPDPGRGVVGWTARLDSTKGGRRVRHVALTVNGVAARARPRAARAARLCPTRPARADRDERRLRHVVVRRLHRARSTASR